MNKKIYIADEKNIFIVIILFVSLISVIGLSIFSYFRWKEDLIFILKNEILFFTLFYFFSGSAILYFFKKFISEFTKFRTTYLLEIHLEDHSIFFYEEINSNRKMISSINLSDFHEIVMLPKIDTDDFLKIAFKGITIHGINYHDIIFNQHNLKGHIHKKNHQRILDLMSYALRTVEK